MAKRKQVLTREEINAAESGRAPGTGECLVALGYPAPYSVGASSLGFQTVFRELNADPSICCERFFLDTALSGPPVTLESGRFIGHAAAIGFSVACETDLLQVVVLLRQAGLAPLTVDRRPSDPLVVIGGPLTLLDSRLCAPLADVVVCGEAEDALLPLADALVNHRSKPAQRTALRDAGCGIWVPSEQCDPPALHQVSKDRLPAHAATWSSLADFRNLYLIEIARGCPRRCAFCLLAGGGRFRVVPADEIVARIPDEVDGVGLVGAAVTDHPQLEEIVARIVDDGKRVSLSSMRADRLTPYLLRLLVKGGLRTLTVAADGASQRIRDEIRKGISEQHLLNAVEMARAEKLNGVKLYSMVGLPGETDADVDEFSRFLTELSKQIRITVAVQSFVPKPNTPLAHATMADEKVLKQRLNRFARAMKGKVVIQSTSPRWSWVDWKLAHGREQSALAAIAALEQGGDFSAWKAAIARFLD